MLRFTIKLRCAIMYSAQRTILTADYFHLIAQSEEEELFEILNLFQENEDDTSDGNKNRIQWWHISAPLGTPVPTPTVKR